jgi:hypothetical protein
LVHLHGGFHLLIFLFSKLSPSFLVLCMLSAADVMSRSLPGNMHLPFLVLCMQSAAYDALYSSMPYRLF